MKPYNNFKEFSPKLIIQILSLSIIIICSIGLRLQAATTMYETGEGDFDEFVYVPIAEMYAKSLLNWNWGEIITSEDNPEHPLLAKILFAIGIIFVGEGSLFKMDNFIACRLISILLATGVAIILWKEFGFTSALLWSVSSFSIKYTSQAYLEASLCFFSILAIIAFIKIKDTNNFWWKSSAILVAAAFASKYHAMITVGIIFLGICLLNEESKIKNLITLKMSKFKSLVFICTKIFHKPIIWLLIFLIAFCIFNPRILNNPLAFVSSFSYHYDYSQSEGVKDPNLLRQFEWLLGDSNPTIWHQNFPIIYLDGIIFVGSIFGIFLLFLLAFNSQESSSSRKYWTIILFYSANVIFLIFWTTRWPQYLTLFEIPITICCGIFIENLFKYAIYGEIESLKGLTHLTDSFKRYFKDLAKIPWQNLPFSIVICLIPMIIIPILYLGSFQFLENQNESYITGSIRDLNDFSIADWQKLPENLSVNSQVFIEGEIIWKDALNDDIGDGDYSYPSPNRIFATKNYCDLLELRIIINSNYFYFLLQVVNFTQVGWQSPIGQDLAMIYLGIDTDQVHNDDNGLLEITEAETTLNSSCERLLKIGRNIECFNTEDIFNWQLIFDANENDYQLSTTDNWLEFRVPRNKIYSPIMRFYLLIGLEEFDSTREIDLDPTEWNGGGGIDGESDSDFYDCAFFNSTDQQSTAIANQLIDAYIDVEFANNTL
ncbi:MAG: glucodextranase DOMON-like domain-containing protein [Promethearchaeota archaeon]